VFGVCGDILSNFSKKLAKLPVTGSEAKDRLSLKQKTKARDNKERVFPKETKSRNNIDRLSVKKTDLQD
jgi:hypothetical protein